MIGRILRIVAWLFAAAVLVLSIAFAFSAGDPR